MRQLQPPISASPAQMAWGRADALQLLMLLERVISCTCVWVWREKATRLGPVLLLAADQ